MNWLHRRYCRSDHWRRTAHNEILPWTLDGIELGDAVLEVGPGPGATTEWLRRRVEHLDCLEIDPELADALQRRLGSTNVSVRRGDATAMPYEGSRFSGVVSFTMLHHIPTAELQDQFLAEACRVLRPHGIFAGVDSLNSLLMRVFHIGDTMTLVDPGTLASRLIAAGFTQPRIDVSDGRVRFSARRPVDEESIEPEEPAMTASRRTTS
jgi:SAM-dependent methyltransferase